MPKTTQFKDLEREWLADPEVRAEYDALAPQHAMERRIIQHYSTRTNGLATITKATGLADVLRVVDPTHWHYYVYALLRVIGHWPEASDQSAERARELQQVIEGWEAS